MTTVKPEDEDEEEEEYVNYVFVLFTRGSTVEANILIRLRSDTHGLTMQLINIHPQDYVSTAI